MIQEHIKMYHKMSEELFEVENNPSALSDDETRAEEFERLAFKAKGDCRHLMLTGQSTAEFWP